jgi:hypothetical protein
LKAGQGSPVISAQYLYYRTKLDDDHNPDEDGTSIEAALRVLKDHGCCLSYQLPYMLRHDIPQGYTVRGHKAQQTETALRDAAKKFRIKSFRLIRPVVESVKAELAAGRAVGVGLAIYELAWYNSLTKSKGEISLPILDTSGPQVQILDTYIGGHAVALVGYRDNVHENEKSHRPGGGYFVFRNSWGDEWAPKSDFKRGYGVLPYEYLSRFCLEAAVIDDLEPAKTGSSREGGKKGDAGSTVEARGAGKHVKSRAGKRSNSPKRKT